MKIIGIIQARMGSGRLPGKILYPIAGQPLLEVVKRRVQSASVKEWWLATTTLAEDDVTAEWGTALGLQVHRGSVDDVLSRFVHIIDRRSPDWIVRVTADDPFMDGAIVDRLIAEIPTLPNVDGVAGPPAAGFPLGYVPQLARASAVLEASRVIPADQPYHRTHVLSWLQVGGRFRNLACPTGWPRRPEWRWTVDHPADLHMARKAFELLGESWPSAGYPEIVARLDENPETPLLNAGLSQKALHEG